MHASNLEEKNVVEKKSNLLLTDTVLNALKIVGETAGLAHKAADRTANGMIYSAHKVIAAPAKINLFGSCWRDRRLLKQQIKHLQEECIELQRQQENFYLRLGKRLSQLDISAADSDAQLLALLESSDELKQKLSALEEERIQLIDQKTSAVNKEELEQTEEVEVAVEKKEETEIIKSEEETAPSPVVELKETFETTEPGMNLQNCEPVDDLVASKVEEVIKQHPEGISLPEIGDCLEVQWRILVSVVGKLIKDGKVKKEARKYYFVKTIV